MNVVHQAAETQEILPTRQSLLSRLKNWSDQASWNDFFATYWKLIYSIARKAGCTDSEAQDVVQETVIAVSRNIPNFKYDPKVGSFKSWLLQMTRWRIRDELRRRTPELALGDPELELHDPATAALEREWDAEWSKNLLEAAMERVKRKVDPKYYQIFDLSVLQQWPVPRICAFLNVTRGRVYLARHRTSSIVKKELRNLEKQWSESST